jgi:HTH-type transcriptional regulator, glycine betaine synthesis regulator
MSKSDKQSTDSNGSLPNPEFHQIHDSMLDGLGQLADYFGFSKVMGQLYGTLLLSPKPLSLDDMTERLAISKASVSINLNTLEHLGMVRQVWVRGGNGRRKYFEAETDFWQIITNVLSGREMRDVERAIAVMDEHTRQLHATMSTMGEEQRQTAAVYIDRMAKLQSLFRFAQTLIATIVAQTSDTNFSEIKHIEIE